MNFLFGGLAAFPKIAHYALDNDLTLKDAALKLGFVTEAEFDKVFRAHEAPTEVPEHTIDASEAVDGRIRLANVLRQAGAASAMS